MKYQLDFLSVKSAMINTEKYSNNYRYSIHLIGRLLFKSRINSIKIMKFVFAIFLIFILNFYTSNAVEQLLTDLKSSNNQADFLIITHPNFTSEIYKYMQWRQKKSGLNIKIILIDDIYSQFYSKNKVESLNEFTTYAMNNWEKPFPRFILLVGSIIHIPSNKFISIYSQMYNEDSVSFDQWYAINKNDSDLIPDAAIGRFPARTIEDLQNMIAKTMLFEDKFDEIDYKYDLTSLTDCVNADSFEEASENFIKNSLPSGYKIKKIYNRAESEFYGDKSDLINTMNEGSAILCNFLHGSPNDWGKKKFITSTDIDTLHLQNKPFLLTSISCSQSYDNPSQMGILEKLITMQSGGILASIASTGIMFGDESEILINTFFQTLFKNPEYTIGEALQQFFMQNIQSDYLYLTLYHRFSILGDPTLKLPKNLIASVQFSLSEQNEENKIFPNPVSEYLNFKENELFNNKLIQIYTLEGIKVIETLYRKKIDVTSLLPGMYLIRTGNKFYKFMKI